MLYTAAYSCITNTQLHYMLRLVYMQLSSLVVRDITVTYGLCKMWPEGGLQRTSRNMSLSVYLWCVNINTCRFEFFSAVTCRSALNSLQRPVTLIALFVAHLVSVTSDVFIQTQTLQYSLTNLITFSVHSITATTHSANWQLPFTRSCLIIFDVSFPRQPVSPNLLMS